jgi:epoxyqueuosine reductase QueG
VSLRHWLEEGDDELLAEFERLYVPRNDARWLQRNALIAAGNVGTDNLKPSLERHLEGDDPMLRETATWALNRLVERSA